MTKSAEDYIETIHVLIRATGRARVRDVAKALNVKMPSVVKAISELKKMSLVVQVPYGDIELTEKGRRCATLILGRHTLLKAFLEKLGVSAKVADRDACLMEHILSTETLDRMRDFLGKVSAAPARRRPAPAKKTPPKKKSPKKRAG